ncbi:MAG TPA: NIL domain-containing protein [Dehalococcoidia bacterium]|nr:NIL domain-containing protein [Dehalococcoidia bacterium]
MAKKRVRLTFEEELVQRPVVYELGKNFEVVTNIRMADVEEHFGWVVLELDGESDEIERGLEWVSSVGVRVDPVAGDVVEG